MTFGTAPRGSAGKGVSIPIPLSEDSCANRRDKWHVRLAYLDVQIKEIDPALRSPKLGFYARDRMLRERGAVQKRICRALMAVESIPAGVVIMGAHS